MYTHTSTTLRRTIRYPETVTPGAILSYACKCAESTLESFSSLHPYPGRRGWSADRPPPAAPSMRHMSRLQLPPAQRADCTRTNAEAPYIAPDHDTYMHVLVPWQATQQWHCKTSRPAARLQTYASCSTCPRDWRCGLDHDHGEWLHDRFLRCAGSLILYYYNIVMNSRSVLEQWTSITLMPASSLQRRLSPVGDSVSTDVLLPLVGHRTCT